MKRVFNSHKGENGKVAIVGGSSNIHGAPLFCALAAEATGVDLIFVCVPKCHCEIAKTTSLNFQIHPFSGNEIDSGDIESVLELLATMDSAVIGPGLSRNSLQLNALNQLISGAACSLVLDASALQKNTLELVYNRNAILTPHKGELERMELNMNTAGNAAQKYGVSILTKSSTDVLFLKDGTSREISGGNAGLSVGGTGDVLTGIIAGLLALGANNEESCVFASKTVKSAGDILFEKYGYAFTAMNVIHEIPGLIKKYF